MRTFTILGVLFALFSAHSAAPECHFSETNTCINMAMDWFHSLPRQSLPHTEEDLVVMCQVLLPFVDCLVEFKDKCTTFIQKEIFDLVVEGAFSAKDDFCNPESQNRKNYVAHGNCLNNIAQMEEVKEQIEYILALLEKVQTMPLSSMAIYDCCAFRKMYNYFVDLSDEKCGKEATASVMSFINMIASQLPNVLCNGIEPDSKPCQDVLLPEGAKPSANAEGSEIFKTLRYVLKNWLD